MSARPVASPRPRCEALFADEARFLAPGTQSIAQLSRLAIDRGEGAVLYDVDGHAYLDLAAGVGVASLGHAHPKYVAALKKQLDRVHVGSFTTEHRAALVGLLAQIAPGDICRTQLYSGGAEAVEAAIRLARSHTKKREIIGFWGGFHGKTGGVLPILGSDFKRGLGPLAPGAYLTPYASCARCDFDQSFPACHFHCVEFLRKKIAVETTGDLAAIVVEPVQGTAGNVIPPRGFLPALRALADELGALLIVDEMITGFGRTGAMFAVEHEGVVPDVITIGKGLGGGVPVSGILARDAVASARPFANASGSSSSFGGNPLAAAAARVTIETILEEGLVEHARALGLKMLAEIQTWPGAIPIVTEPRGLGLMLGLSLVYPGTRRPLDAAVTHAIFASLLARGVLAMVYAPEVRLNPPLVIREDQAMAALAILREVLVDAAARLPSNPAP